MIEDVSPISRKNDLFGANFGGTPCRSSQKGTPRGLRTLTELFALPSFSALALPVILLRLRHFLPVIRPWWSVFAPFNSLAAAASAKDKAPVFPLISVHGLSVSW